MSFINEMSVGSSVKLTYVFKAGKITQETTIIGILDKNEGIGIKCDFLRHEGKILNPSVGLQKVEILDSESNRIFCFLNPTAVNSYKNNALIIISKHNVKPINNRGAFRLPCSYQCDIRFRSHTGVVNGMVHDISYSGASCTFTKENKKPNIGDDISITIYDELNKGIGVKLTGSLVRFDEGYSEDRMLIGFTIDQEDSVRMIINSLQRRQLKVKNS